ncbi:U5 small nuclear ribonucleoprotein TSSC4 [Malaya genurostris]|uniref:U5 small nuclear ribonucleoprotein TSSC4 n=1 Tax=Malaya genurostris TaxID=325434 RepID=UPI0026F3B5C7|nr:U5 small nuclear ribonucleoprotein TSSC4 [Malaya genurostris]
MSYEERKNALFASLETAEREIPVGSILHQQDFSHDRRVSINEDRQDHQRSASKSIKKFRGRESIFKRPALPINRCLPTSRVPDFKKNPHKWTKYSLEDVDISDRTNTAAAFSFLREMETQKQEDEKMAEEVSSGGSTSFRGKVRFNRSLKLKSHLEEEDEPSQSKDDTPKVKGSKVLMPEYVVGQKIKKTKSVRLGTATSKRDRSKELKLDHLLEEEGDSGD